MTRSWWNGTCEKFSDNVPCTDMITWISAIPFEDWPQQHPVDEQLRPAMVTDPHWHDFDCHMRWFTIDNPCPLGPMRVPRVANGMLSVVMPGHRIEPHKDTLADDWICRVHVPLVTNPAAEFIIEGQRFHMQVGSGYKVNISKEHAIFNDGSTPRIHFMFDCYES